MFIKIEVVAVGKYYSAKSYALFVCGMIVALIYSVFNFIGLHNQSIVLKGIASLFFIVLAFLTSAKLKNVRKNIYVILIIVGLIFGMFGDILIELPTEWGFVAAAGSFAVGHILYSIAFCYVSGISKKQMLVFALCSVFVIAYMIFMPYINAGDLLAVGIVYGLIISFMVGSAVSLWKKDMSIPKKLCVAGAVLFLLSDFILLHDLFVTAIDCSFLVFFNTITYYPAQFVLALSLADPFSKREA